MSDPAQPIRAAATVVVWRDNGRGPEILMGQRGSAAVFMPSKYVFPGGAVDPGDVAPASFLTSACLRRLTLSCPEFAPEPLALTGAAQRELAEETGLILQSTAGLRFIFRAITPPGRPRRFDARFFILSSNNVAGDPDDFGAASDELGHLHWIGVGEARSLDLPFITEVVIAEVAALLAGRDQPGVPFFDNSSTTPVFRRLV